MDFLNSWFVQRAACSVQRPIGNDIWLERLWPNLLPSYNRIFLFLSHIGVSDSTFQFSLVRWNNDLEFMVDLIRFDSIRSENQKRKDFQSYGGYNFVVILDLATPWWIHLYSVWYSLKLSQTIFMLNIESEQSKKRTEVNNAIWIIRNVRGFVESHPMKIRTYESDCERNLKR